YALRPTKAIANYIGRFEVVIGKLNWLSPQWQEKGKPLLEQLQRKINTEHPDWPTALPKEELQKQCFVATATIGAPDHPAVLLLREFRDTVLAKTRFGNSFICHYYKHGPRLANLV